MEDSQIASEIADDLLLRTGEAMQTGDFDAFIDCFSLPIVLETFDGRQLLQKREDVKRIFDAIRDFRAANAVRRVVRENVAAEFLQPDAITATHVSRMLLDGDILFGRPYPAYSLIKRTGDTWRIQFCQYAVDEPEELNVALSGGKRKTPQDSAASSSN